MAGRRPAVPAEGVPASAPDYPERALRRTGRGFPGNPPAVVILDIPILAPLLDIAVHIIQAEAVRRVTAYLACPSQTGTPVGGGLPGEVGLFQREGVTEVEDLIRRRSSATGILPFRLTRQAVHPAPS